MANALMNGDAAHCLAVRDDFGIQGFHEKLWGLASLFLPTDPAAVLSPSHVLEGVRNPKLVCSPPKDSSQEIQRGALAQTI